MTSGTPNSHVRTTPCTWRYPKTIKNTPALGLEATAWYVAWLPEVGLGGWVRAIVGGWAACAAGSRQRVGGAAWGRERESSRARPTKATLARSLRHPSTTPIHRNAIAHFPSSYTQTPPLPSTPPLSPCPLNLTRTHHSLLGHSASWEGKSSASRVSCLLYTNRHVHPRDLFVELTFHSRTG